jgi:RNase P protein component
MFPEKTINKSCRTTKNFRKFLAEVCDFVLFRRGNFLKKSFAAFESKFYQLLNNLSHIRPQSDMAVLSYS